MRNKPEPPTDLELKPSRVTDRYWLLAQRKKGEYPQSTNRSGKWLVFIPASRVDDIWARVKESVEEGRLGDRAKVATGRPNPHAQTPERRVICVYTYDSEDRSDVMRIREELRRLGVPEKIPYKTDADTLAGKYRTKGHRNISKYNE
jgi:hypothetical protein